MGEVRPRKGHHGTEDSAKAGRTRDGRTVASPSTAPGTPTLHQKITITDANGLSTRTWPYAYTGSDLTSCTDPAGNVTNYSYDANHNLTEIDDPPQNGGARPTTTMNYVNHQLTWIRYAKTSP